MSKVKVVNELESLASEWYQLKRQISQLKSKQDIIKHVIQEHLENEDETDIDTNNYEISIIKRSRNIVLKKDIPSDIWNKYMTRKEYEILSIKKRK